MEWSFIWTNLNIHYLKNLYAKFLWSRWRRKFLKIVNFLLFHFYRTLEQGLSFRLTNWNPLYPKMFTSAMFGRNSPSGSGGENFLIWPTHFVSQGTEPSFAKKKKKWCLLTQKFVWNYPMYWFICMGFIVFNVTITSEGLQILTYARHSWPWTVRVL